MLWPAAAVKKTGAMVGLLATGP
ncbi:MAG: hypothetical protein QOF84_6861, partial [Streptomyces sp.]|nr:hypothetical protein [Streptomyces sp.]